MTFTLPRVYTTHAFFFFFLDKSHSLQVKKSHHSTAERNLTGLNNTNILQSVIFYLTEINPRIQEHASIEANRVSICC